MKNTGLISLDHDQEVSKSYGPLVASEMRYIGKRLLSVFDEHVLDYSYISLEAKELLEADHTPFIVAIAKAGIFPEMSIGVLYTRLAALRACTAEGKYLFDDHALLKINATT